MHRTIAISISLAAIVFAGVVWHIANRVRSDEQEIAAELQRVVVAELRRGHAMVVESSTIEIRSVMYFRPPILEQGEVVTTAEFQLLSRLPNVTYLYLDDARLCDADLKHISHLTSLRGLRIGSFNISDEAIPDLASLERMEWLALQGTSISSSGIEMLRWKMPMTDVQVFPGRYTYQPVVVPTEAVDMP